MAGFAVIMAVGQFSPGPDMLWLTRVALRDGRRAGLLTAMGIACGLAVHATLALSGLALLFHRHVVFSNALRVVSAGYLVWLGIRILRDRGMPDGAADPQPGDRPFRRGLLCNLANPKVALLLAAICVPFLQSAPAWMPVALWLIIVVQGGALWALWVCILQRPSIRRIHRRHARHLDVGFAWILIALAVWMGLAM